MTGTVTSMSQGKTIEVDTDDGPEVEEDENIAAYVARIEEMEDEAGTEVSVDGLAAEIERYLRGRRLS